MSKEKQKECLSEVLEWFDNDGLIGGVHYDDASIKSRIKEVLNVPTKMQKREYTREDGARFVEYTPAELTRLVLIIEGGICQNVFTNQDSVDVIILDADSDGADDENLVTVGEDGLEYIMGKEYVETDRPYVDKVFALWEA